MSTQWELITDEADEKFLRSLKIVGRDWRNTNSRFRDDYHAHNSDYRPREDWILFPLAAFALVAVVVVFAVVTR